MTVFSRWWTPFGVIGGGGHSDDFVADIPPPAELLTLPGVVWGIDLLLDLIGEDICGVGPAKGGVLQRQTPPFAALFFSHFFDTNTERVAGRIRYAPGLANIMLPHHLGTIIRNGLVTGGVFCATNPPFVVAFFPRQFDRPFVVLRRTDERAG